MNKIKNTIISVIVMIFAISCGLEKELNNRKRRKHNQRTLITNNEKIKKNDNHFNPNDDPLKKTYKFEQQKNRRTQSNGSQIGRLKYIVLLSTVASGIPLSSVIFHKNFKKFHERLRKLGTGSNVEAFPHSSSINEERSNRKIKHNINTPIIESQTAPTEPMIYSDPSLFLKEAAKAKEDFENLMLR